MTTAYDMWSLGVLLYEMCTLEFPFDGDSVPAMRTSILQKDFKPIPDTYSSNLNSMITGLLRKNPKNRLRMGQILKDSLVKKVGIAVYGQTQFNSMVVATTLPSPLLLNSDKSWMEVVRGIKSSPFYKSYLVAATNPNIYKQTRRTTSPQPQRAVSKPPKPDRIEEFRQPRQFSLGMDRVMLKSDNSVLKPQTNQKKAANKDPRPEWNADYDFGLPTAQFKKFDSDANLVGNTDEGYFLRTAIRDVPDKHREDPQQQYGTAPKLDTSGSTVALIKRFEVNNDRASSITQPGVQDFLFRKRETQESSAGRIFESPPSRLRESGSVGRGVPVRENVSQAPGDLPFLRDYTIETFYKSRDPRGKLPEFSAGNVLRQLEQVEETLSNFDA